MKISPSAALASVPFEGQNIIGTVVLPKLCKHQVMEVIKKVPIGNKTETGSITSICIFLYFILLFCILQLLLFQIKQSPQALSVGLQDSNVVSSEVS